MTATQQRPATTGTRKKDDYLYGLDLLRVVGSCAVVVTHLIAWFAIYDQEFWLMTWVDEGVVGTLHVNPRMHFMGVAVFLVVSGVVVTHVADRETPAQFLRRRVVRLVPLLWVATLLAWILINLGFRVSGADDPELGVGDLLRGLVLGNFFQIPQVGLVGVTWTLLVQIGFYAWVAATIPVLRRHPWIPPLAAAPLCFVVVLLTFGSDWPWARTAGGLVAYLPLLCIGQLISLVHSRKITPLVGTAIGAVHFLFVVWVDKLSWYASQGDSVPRTLLIALLLAVLLVAMKGPVSRSAFVRGWAKRTYAIYLVHVMAMYPVFGLLMPHLNRTLVVVIGVVWVAVLSEVLHRFIEMPADRAVRRWERRRRERREAARAG
ncbi:MAG: acyltransferase [Saccharothrix sp.]|nr:acyltransferase [Saccharothrix sp.]